MDDTKIDRETIAKMAKALVFICGAANPVTLAMQKAAEGGAAGDIKRARGLFLKMKPGDRAAVLAMISG